MKAIRLVAVAVAALLGSAAANAALVYSLSSNWVYVGPLSFNGGTNGSVTSPITGSVTNQWLAPLTVGDQAYSLISTGGTATVDFGTGVSSFSFLWGSPDSYNILEVDTNDSSDATYGGTAVFGILANGQNQNTRLFTLSATGGTLINSVTFRNTTQPAFEVAAATAVVPLPAAAWLMLSGLAGLGLVGRRRKRA